jgi:hypothetical protein
MHRLPPVLCLGVTLFVLAGCERSLPGQLAGCQVYRPRAAKRTFDGRVGAVLLRNAGPRSVEVRIYHPDGLGDVELRRQAPAGAELALQGADSSRLVLGNDWGIQVGQSCVAPWARRPSGLRTGSTCGGTGTVFARDWVTSGSWGIG